MRGRPPNTDAEMEEDMYFFYPQAQADEILGRYYACRRIGMPVSDAAVATVLEELNRGYQRLSAAIGEAARPVRSV